MTLRRIALSAGLLAGCLASSGEAAGPAPPAASTPASLRTRNDLSLLASLHHLFLYNALAGGDALGSYKAELEEYRQAREQIKEPSTWRLLNDLCVVAPDIAAIRQAAENLPGALPAADREGARRMLRALAAAWPLFEQRDLIHHRIAVQDARAKILNTLFAFNLEPKLIPLLYEKMGFQPIDAPITIYPVVEMDQLGAWGKTQKGYYLLVPTARRTPLQVVEMLVHELTHVIEASQPAGARPILARIRQKAIGVDAARLEEFLHGLVEFNAGELVRGVGSAGYRPILETSPLSRQKVAAWLPAYEDVWRRYLSGQIKADSAVESLAAELLPASPTSQDPPPGP